MKNNLVLTLLLLTFSFKSLATTVHFGSAGYGNHTPDEWYTVDTYSYPETTALSQHRDLGISRGRVYLSPTGITVGEEGDYEVSITAILQNPSGTDSLLLPVYLSLNEEFDPENTNPIGGVGVIYPGDISTISGSGFLRNVEEGTRLSLVITNGGYPFPQPVLVAGWSIQIRKID